MQCCAASCAVIALTDHVNVIVPYNPAPLPFPSSLTGIITPFLSPLLPPLVTLHQHTSCTCWRNGAVPPYPSLPLPKRRAKAQAQNPVSLPDVLTAASVEASVLLFSSHFSSSHSALAAFAALTCCLPLMPCTSTYHSCFPLSVQKCYPLYIFIFTVLIHAVTLCHPY